MDPADRVAALLGNPRTWVDLGGDLEGSYDGSKYVDFRVKGEDKPIMFASREVVQKAEELFPLRVAARYKQKKQTEEGNTVYLYSDRQIAYRNRKKAERLEKLRNSIGALRTQVRKDLGSDDPDRFLPALAVALIDHTYERVGNPASADEGHFGVTGWTKNHISFGKGKANINYVGKAGVKQKKAVTDARILKALRKAYDAADNDIFSPKEGSKLTAGKVNGYLKQFGITAKDLRGFHANQEMKDRLKAIRAQKGPLPEDKAAREKQLKAEFNKALDATAKAVGHEAATLKSQYLVPGLESTYLKSGRVPGKMKMASAEEHSLTKCAACDGLVEQCKCDSPDRALHFAVCETCKKAGLADFASWVLDDTDTDMAEKVARRFIANQK